MRPTNLIHCLQLLPITAISVSNARQQHDPEVPAGAHVYAVQRCLCLYIRPALLAGCLHSTVNKSMPFLKVVLRAQASHQAVLQNRTCSLVPAKPVLTMATRAYAVLS